MLRVVEMFSGIGSQAKALKTLGIEHEIVATVEWDIGAIYAYDIIHNGPQNPSLFANLTKKELVSNLHKYTLSNNGKVPIKKDSLNKLPIETLRRVYIAIQRSRNLVSIKDINAEDLPRNIDLLTYSFPCQDLSISGRWHGNVSGINRNSNNRSSLLWEVERLLMELVNTNAKLPKFLLMENVTNILSNIHSESFEEWKNYLEGVGYHNQLYTLSATNFGIPQNRKRTFMLSVLAKRKGEKKLIKRYFDRHNLEKVVDNNLPNLENFLKLDYSISKYKKEADWSNPNDTPSRRKIMNENIMIYDGEMFKVKHVNTITTKQDRNPNSGLVAFSSDSIKKSPYRNLTPRECFLLMGFDEKDYQALIDNDYMTRRNSSFFTREKLIRLVGNSIVVNVLVEIFKQVDYISENILSKD